MVPKVESKSLGGDAEKWRGVSIVSVSQFDRDALELLVCVTEKLREEHDQKKGDDIFKKSSNSMFIL